MPTATEAAPTTEQSGSGRPLGRVPLDEGMIARIQAKATSSAPASQVANTSAKPISTNEATNTPAAAVEAAPTTPSPTPTAPKPAGQAATPPAAKDAPPAAKPAAPADADAGKQAKPEGVKQLREVLERREAELEALKASGTATNKQLADAHAKVAEFEGRVRSYEDKFAKEYEPQIKRLTEKEKRLQEVEEQLRVRDYTATPQFHDTYVKPIVEVQQEALQFMGELVATVEGQKVQATKEHLEYVIGAPNANGAAARAEQLFGTTFTPQLVNYRQRLRALTAKRAEAVQKASVESETFFKQQQESQQVAEARFRQTVEQRIGSYLLKPVDNDPDEAAALMEGEKFAKQVAEGVVDLDQRADLSARILATAKNDRLKDVRLRKQGEEIAALKEQLGRYQRNEPDVETTGGGAPAADEEQGNGVPVQGSSPQLRSHLLSKLRSASRGF